MFPITLLFERRLAPKGKRGRRMVRLLGRNYKTGMFAEIARKAAKKYGSAEAGRRVAAAIFWRKAGG